MTDTRKVLFVITSHDQLGDSGQLTGLWLEEFAAPYYTFQDAGFDITLASPKGGRPPIDPKSEDEDFRTDATRRFGDDPVTQEAFKNTLKLADVRADDYDAVFFPGGHGPLWDLATLPASIALVEEFWAQKKPVSAVCHASIVLMNTQDADGVPLVKGRNVTGFTNSEEGAVGLTEVVPHLVEDTLVEQGANFSCADDFVPFAIKDGNLITGQNPASSHRVAELVIETLK